MAKPGATLDEVWSGFETLTPLLQDKFIERLIDDDRFRQEIEDILDFATVTDREKEPSRPLDDVLAEIGRQSE